jgi:hypothetical protein
VGGGGYARGGLSSWLGLGRREFSGVDGGVVVVEWDWGIRWIESNG